MLVDYLSVLRQARSGASPGPHESATVWQMFDQGKFLVLGASGLLGRHVSRLLGPGRVVATYRSRRLEGAIHFDALTMRLRDTLLKGAHDFRAAFILHGITRLDDCACDPAGTAQVNVDSICNVIDDLIDAGVKPVFFSSDAVFDGSRGMWKETDPTHPILTYGKQKLQVEHHLQASAAPWVIARLSKLVSAVAGPRNMLSEWADQIDRNEEILCASDLVSSPADVLEVAQAMIRLAGEPMTGIYHVCGPRPGGRLDFLRMLIDAIGGRSLNVPRVSVCKMSDLNFREPRPLDVSMQPAKLYAALGTVLRDMVSICADFARNRYEGATTGVCDAR